MGYFDNPAWRPFPAEKYDKGHDGRPGLTSGFGTFAGTEWKFRIGHRTGTARRGLR